MIAYPFSTLAYGFVPEEMDFSVPDPFIKLLSQPDAEFVFLIELYPYDENMESLLFGTLPFGTVAFGQYGLTVTGGLQRICLSDMGFTTTPNDSVPNQYFAPLVDNPLQFDASILSGGELGADAPSYGSISIQNNDGDLDYLEQYNWTGRRIVVKAGGSKFKYDNFTVIFQGLIGDISFDDDRISLSISDNRQKLDQLLQVITYDGTGDLEGGDDLAGKVKPQCFGEVLNIEPVLVDVANLVYQVHAGSIFSVDAVRDSGVLLTYAGDVSDILSAVVAAGQFVTNLASGYIKIGSTPAGRITADVKGSNNGGYISTAGDIIRRILFILLGTKSFSVDEIDNGSFNRLNTVLSGAMGYYINDRITPRTILNDLLTDCAAYWTFTRQGLLTVGWLDEVGEADLDIQQFEIDEPGISITKSSPPAWQITLGYAPVDTVQKEDELAGATTDEDRSFLGEQFRYLTSRNDVALTLNAHATEKTYFTRLVNKADAETLLERLQRINNKDRRVYSLTLKNLLFRVYIGDVVKPHYPRYGMSEGKNLLIVGNSDDAENSITTLELWG